MGRHRAQHPPPCIARTGRPPRCARPPPPAARPAGAQRPCLPPARPQSSLTLEELVELLEEGRKWQESAPGSRKLHVQWCPHVGVDAACVGTGSSGGSVFYGAGLALAAPQPSAAAALQCSFCCAGQGSPLSTGWPHSLLPLPRLPDCAAAPRRAAPPASAGCLDGEPVAVKFLTDEDGAAAAAEAQALRIVAAAETFVRTRVGSRQALPSPPRCSCSSVAASNVSAWAGQLRWLLRARHALGSCSSAGSSRWVVSGAPACHVPACPIAGLLLGLCRLPARAHKQLPKHRRPVARRAVRARYALAVACSSALTLSCSRQPAGGPPALLLPPPPAQPAAGAAQVADARDIRMAPADGAGAQPLQRGLLGAPRSQAGQRGSRRALQQDSGSGAASSAQPACCSAQPAPCV